MARFPCRSKLVFKPRLEDRRLEVFLEREYHARYKDNTLPPKVIREIESRCDRETAPMIYKHLRNSGFEQITIRQVYCRCRAATQDLWRHDDDQVVSTLTTLAAL